MRREFKKGEEIFAWNYLERDLNGFGIVLEDKVVDDDDEIVYIKVNGSGENEETADRIYKVANNKICSRCGCVLLHEHEEEIDYPYCCPYCDENKFGFEVTKTNDEEFARCFEDSVGRFYYEED